MGHRLVMSPGKLRCSRAYQAERHLQATIDSNKSLAAALGDQPVYALYPGPRAERITQDIVVVTADGDPATLEPQVVAVHVPTGSMAEHVR